MNHPAATNLFGELVKPARKRTESMEKQPARQPQSAVENPSQESVWTPKVGEIAYLNSGIGYDLRASRRLGATGCFGYILVVNTDSQEALIHVPKPINRPGRDEFYIMPLRGLRDCDSVCGFDRNGFIQHRPPVACPIALVWDVNPRR